MERYTLVKKIGTGSYGSAYLVKLKTDRCGSNRAGVLLSSLLPSFPDSCRAPVRHNGVLSASITGSATAHAALRQAAVQTSSTEHLPKHSSSG